MLQEVLKIVQRRAVMGDHRFLRLTIGNRILKENEDEERNCNDDR